MQAVINGVKSMLRTPGKTALFTSLLMVLALLLSITFCVFASVHGYLQDCDDYFHTVINLEYIGKDYPAAMVYDHAATDAVTTHQTELNALRTADGVLSFEPAMSSVALIDTLHRTDYETYDPEAAVLCVYVMSTTDALNAYTAQIVSVLYSRDKVDGKMVLLRTDSMDDPSALQPEKGGTYVMAGHFFQGPNSYLWFQAESIILHDADGEKRLPAFESIAGNNVPEDSDYRRLAELFRLQNNSCRVQSTAALEDLLPFHQQELSLTEGRMFTQEEYENAAPVCVLSSRIAGKLDLSPGSKIDLRVYTAENGDIYHSLLSEPDPPLEYEVVGIYEENEAYPCWIFLPDKAAAEQGIGPVTGYRLGQFRVENDKASAFYTSVQGLTEYGFRFSVYDQGYSAATEPMRELLLISVVFLVVCILLAVAALCLQSHVFVSRQRETAQTMYALGSGTRHIFCYFLSATTLLALPSALLGGVLGKRAEQQVFLLLQQFASGHTAQDLRFSNSRLSLVRTLDFRPIISPLIYCAAGLFLILCSMLFTGLFAYSSLRKQQPKQKKTVRHRPTRVYRGRSSRLSGPLKYTLLSIRRSYTRAISLLLLCAMIALFFGQLTASLDGYQTQLDAVCKNTVLTGYASDASGQAIDGLVVRGRVVNRLVERDILSDYNVSNSISHCRFVGIPVTAAGETQAVPEPVIPTSAFAVETFFGQMYDEPSWVRTSSVSGSSVFHYTKIRDISWLEGYSEADFMEKTWLCALPHTMMESRGIQLGDTVRFLYALHDWGRAVIDTVDMKVVASYVSSTDHQVVFSPIGCTSLASDRAFLGTIYLNESADGSYDSFLFTLNDTAQLNDLRQALEDAGFTYVHSGNRSRPCAVIEDAVFLNTTQSMERQIQYVSILYNCLYVLAGIIGIVLSWLLTAARKAEISIMRALGTQHSRIVLTFFTEQAALCTLGLLAGILFWRLSGHIPSQLQWLLTFCFLGCWCLSALLCLLTTFARQTNASLSDPE